MKTIFYLLALALALSACAPSQPPGRLEGKVTVGPLTPVQKVGEPEPTPPPEVFTSRSLVVYQPGSGAPGWKVALHGDGTYSIDLPPGHYLLRLGGVNSIEHATTADGKALPVGFDIRSGQGTRIDLSIDTGIR